MDCGQPYYHRIRRTICLELGGRTSGRWTETDRSRAINECSSHKPYKIPQHTGLSETDNAFSHGNNKWFLKAHMVYGSFCLCNCPVPGIKPDPWLTPLSDSALQENSGLRTDYNGKLYSADCLWLTHAEMYKRVVRCVTSGSLECKDSSSFPGNEGFCCGRLFISSSNWLSALEQNGGSKYCGHIG